MEVINLLELRYVVRRKLSQSTFIIIKKAVKNGIAEKFLEDHEKLNLYKGEILYLISGTENYKKYLEKNKRETFGLSSSDIVKLIIDNGNPEEFLTEESIIEYSFNSKDIIKLILATHDIEMYLTSKEKAFIRKYLNKDNIVELIKESGEIRKYLTPEFCKNVELGNYEISQLIFELERSGYNISEFGRKNKIYFEAYTYKNLIYATKDIDKYILNGTAKRYNLYKMEIIELIENSGNIDSYITLDIKNMYSFDCTDISSLIINTQNINLYFDAEFLLKMGFNKDDVKDLFFRAKEANKKITKNLTKDFFDAFGFSIYEISDLIIETNNVEEYLTPQKYYELDYDIDTLFKKLVRTGKDVSKYGNTNDKGNYTLANIFIGTGKVEKYLEHRNCSKFMPHIIMIDLIVYTKNIKKYMNPKWLKSHGLKSKDIANLICKFGKAEEYLDNGKFRDYELNDKDIIELIQSTEKIEKYLALNKCKSLKLSSSVIVELIIKTGNIEYYLIPEICKSYNLDKREITELIRETKNPEKYGMKNMYSLCGYIELIKATGRIEEYLIPEKCKELELDPSNITLFIKEIGKEEEYLTPENCILYNLKAKHITWLIEQLKEKGKDISKYGEGKNYVYTILNVIYATGKIEEYLLPEKCKELNLTEFEITELAYRTKNLSKYGLTEKYKKIGIIDLILATGRINEYLTIQKCKELELTYEQIIELIERHRWC